MLATSRRECDAAGGRETRPHDGGTPEESIEEKGVKTYLHDSREDTPSRYCDKKRDPVRVGLKKRVFHFKDSSYNKLNQIIQGYSHPALLKARSKLFILV